MADPALDLEGRIGDSNQRSNKSSGRRSRRGNVKRNGNVYEADFRSNSSDTPRRTSGTADVYQLDDYRDGTLEDGSRNSYTIDPKDNNRAAIKGALGAAAVAGLFSLFQNSEPGRRLEEFMEFWDTKSGDLTEDDIDEAYLILFEGFGKNEVNLPEARARLAQVENTAKYKRFYGLGKTFTKYDQMLHVVIDPVYDLFNYVF